MNMCVLLIHQIFWGEYFQHKEVQMLFWEHVRANLKIHDFSYLCALRILQILDSQVIAITLRKSNMPSSKISYL